MQRRTTLVDWVLVALTAIGLALLLGKDQVAGMAGGLGSKPVGLAGVLTASSSFVLVALRSLYRERSRLSLFLGIGLALCWTGDIVGYVGYFQPSAVAFLVGHLVFATGFVMSGCSERRLGVAAVIVTVASILIACWLLPHVSPEMRSLVIGYLVVISVMVTTACGTKHPNAPLLAVAACLFYVSDIAVAHWKFISDASWHAFACYPLYYPACLLLAFGSRVTGAGQGEGDS